MTLDVTPHLPDAAAAYARRGWCVVPLHNIRADGACTCYLGDKCSERNRGKHPRLKEWQKHATSDETQVEQWWEQWPDANIGILLGEKSGVIDVECDDDAAEKALAELFGGDFPVVPTFQSNRGKHRLFAWTPGLPEAEKAVFKFRGIEFRTGGGQRGAQTVFPPSLHPTGKRYAWLVSLDDAELVPLPLPVIQQLSSGATAPLVAGNNGHAANGSGGIPENIEAAGEPDREESARWKLYKQAHVLETVDGRDDAIYREACAMWREQVMCYGEACLDAAENQTVVRERMQALNLVKCRPPLEQAEVLKKCESARKFIKSQPPSQPARTLAALGLEFHDDEWWPGKWRIVSVRSEPIRVKLFAPFLGEDKFLKLSMEDFDSPSRVHLAVLNATGCVCLDDKPGFWRSVWVGSPASRARAATRGVRAKLLDATKFEEAPSEQKRSIVVATHLWEKLATARPVDEEKVYELKSGAPVRVSDGRLLFSFKAIWEDASRSEDKVKRQEMSELLRELGCKDEMIGGKDSRKKLKCLTHKGLEQLFDVVGLKRD